MAKRENGEGSIYHRKDLKKRPWVAALPGSFELENNSNLQKKQEILGHYATRQEAKQALEKFLDKPVKEINMTVEDVRKIWLSRPEYRDLYKQSKDCYAEAWSKVPDNIRNIKMRDLRNGDMQERIDAYSEQSKISLSYIKTSFSQLYSLAMERDIVNKDYSKFLTLPKKKRGEILTFSSAEVEKIKCHTRML